MKGYLDSVSKAAEVISEAMEITDVPDYVLVIVAGVVGDLHDVEHRRVFGDIKSMLERKRK